MSIHELPPPVRNVTRSVVTDHGIDWLAGPFPAHFQVVLDGKIVPMLTGYAYSDGSVGLTLDHRLGYDFANAADAYTAARAIADAMAMGAGFPSFAAADRWPYGCTLNQLDSIPR